MIKFQGVIWQFLRSLRTAITLFTRSTMMLTEKRSTAQHVKPSSPTTENDLPFRFAQVDDQATLNGTTNINGVPALRYRHLRPAKRVGPGLLPAEDMNWFISKSVVGAAQDLLETHCYEDLPQGGQSDGSRNFQSRYSRNVPEDTFRVQKSLSCKPAKMTSYREKAYGDPSYTTLF